jgi:tetratricopeptide (TPR) repeat protein
MYLYIERFLLLREPVIYRPNPADIPAAHWMLGVLCLIVLLLLAVKRTPLLSLGAIWCLAFFLPVSGFVEIGSHYAANRYFYIPMMGMLVCLAGFLKPVWLRGGAYYWFFLTTITAFLLLTAFSICRQMPDWRDNDTLFRKVQAIYPSDYFAYAMLGQGEMLRGNYGEAAEFFLRSKQCSSLQPKTGMNLAFCYAQRRQWEMAIEELQELQARYPWFESDRVRFLFQFCSDHYTDELRAAREHKHEGNNEQ